MHAHTNPHPAETWHSKWHTGLELIRVLLAETCDQGDRSSDHTL